MSPASDPLVDRGHDLLPGGLLAFEIGLHHLVVGLDNRLDERCVRGVDQFLDLGGQVDLLAVLLALGVLVGALGGHPHQAPQAILTPDRYLDRGDRLAERLPQLIQGSLEGGPVAVELGDHDCPWDALLLGDLPQLLGLNLYAVDTGYHEEGEIDGS